MKRFLFCASALLSPLAFGEGFQPTARLGLDIRMDFISTSDSAEGLKTTKTQEFVAPNPRINLLGELGPKTSYRVRIDASKSFEGGGRDQISDAFNYLYLYHEFNDSLGIRVGKQFIVTSGWEFNYDTSKIYHYGETFLKVPSYYETGAAVEFKFAGQVVGLQAANSQPETDPNAKPQSEDMIQGVYWYGSLLSAMIQPIASAVWFPRVRSENSGIRDEKATVAQYALGTRVDLKPIRFDLTAGQLAIPEYNFFDAQANGQSTRFDEDWLGLVFNSQYSLNPQWQPFAKITYDQSKIDNQNRASFLRYSVGTEYYPESEKWWLHATYAHQDNKQAAVATSKVTLAKSHQKIDSLLLGVGINYY